ncbi:MAG: metallophosphoesterase [Clostridia bacterium]|nr:metallophosphoesterase [Clostridia bacterium]
MSFYAISDLHGYPLEKFKALLEKAGFGEGDTLYVIGDVIDRNLDGGVGLLRYIMGRPDFEFILGNHEDMLLACDFLFEEITDESISELNEMKAAALNRYLRNGGGVTLESLRLLRREDPAAFDDLLDFLRESPLYGAVSCGGRDFLLVHGGLGGFSPEKKLSEYSPHDLIWERPSLETEYFDDVITVFGHTPTLYYGDEYAGKVLFTRTWIDIDAGAASCLPPALLRLDDLAVFYGEEFPDPDGLN